MIGDDSNCIGKLTSDSPPLNGQDPNIDSPASTK